MIKELWTSVNYAIAKSEKLVTFANLFYIKNLNNNLGLLTYLLEN